MSHLWQAVGNTVSELTGSKFQPLGPSAPGTNAFPLHQLILRFWKRNANTNTHRLRVLAASVYNVQSMQKKVAGKQSNNAKKTQYQKRKETPQKIIITINKSNSSKYSKHTDRKRFF